MELWHTGLRLMLAFGTLAAPMLAFTVLAGGAANAKPPDSAPAATPSGYRRQAEEQTDFIQAHFYDSAVNRYRPSLPMKPNELPYDFMWGNGVQFTVLAAAAKEDPAKCRKALDDFASGLSAYWDASAPVPGYEAYCSGPGSPDKYYDDNEWMVLGFAEAYQNTQDRKFLDMAQGTQKFVLSGWDDTLGGGIYWKLYHQSKNTCSNAPAAAAALRLDQVAGDRDQGAWGIRLRDWTQAHLQAPDSLYWDNLHLNGDVEKTKWTYNTALMIRADVLLYQLRGTKPDLAEARRMADASLAFWTDPATGSLQKTEDSPRFTHLLCESLLRLYDVTHDVRYLNAVRREAAFAARYARDPSGGYWDHWTTQPHAPGETKSLIENASAARLFWLLAPYPDPAELTAAGRKAAGHGQEAEAESLLRQAAGSDPDAVESRFYLYKVLARTKNPAAAAEEARLSALASDPALVQRLKAAGWKPPQ